MTVATEVDKVRASGNGSNFSFPFTSMKVFAKSELLVLHVDSADVITILTEGTGASNYSVAFVTPLVDGQSAGTITYPEDEVTAIGSSEQIVIVRVPALLQGTTFSNVGVLLPSNVEVALDKMSHQIQAMQEQFDRGLLFDQAYIQDADHTLPAPRALYSFRWNAAKDALEEVLISGNDAAVPDEFTDLDDTPSAYASGDAGKVVQVKATEDGLEFGAGASTRFDVQWRMPDTVDSGDIASGYTALPFNTVRYTDMADAQLATTLTFVTCTAGITIIIEGLTFTAHATTTTIANREFSISGNDTQDMTAFVSVLTDATYGLQNATAVDNLDGSCTITTDKLTTSDFFKGSAFPDTASWAQVTATAQILVAAGTYDIQGWTQTYRSGTGFSTLYDVTAGAEVIRGNVSHTETGSSSGDDTPLRFMSGRIVLTVATVLEFRHFSVAGKTINGYGFDDGETNAAAGEVYANLNLTKVA